MQTEDPIGENLGESAADASEGAMSINIVVTQPKLLKSPSARVKLVLHPAPRYPPSSSGEPDEDASESRQVTFKVSGMVCAACSASIEKAVKRLPGIVDASVALLQNRAQVVFKPDVVQVNYISHQLTNFIYFWQETSQQATPNHEF